MEDIRVINIEKNTANNTFTADNTSFIGIGGCGCNIIEGQLSKMLPNSQSNYYIIDNSERISTCTLVDEENRIDRNSLLTEDAVYDWIKGCIHTNAIVILCGMGRLKTSRLVSDFAKQAKKLDKTVAIGCIMPFRFEPNQFQKNAKNTLAVLQDDMDIDLVMSFNNDLLHDMKWKGTASESTAYAPVVLASAFSMLFKMAEEGKLSFPERCRIDLRNTEENETSGGIPIEDSKHPEVAFGLYDLQ